MKRYRITADFRSEKLYDNDLNRKCHEIEGIIPKDSEDKRVSWKKRSYLKDGIVFGLIGAIWLTSLSMGLNNDLLTEIVSGILLWPWNIFSQFVQTSNFGVPLLIAGNAFYWVLLGIVVGWACQIVEDVKGDMKTLFGKSN